jgi:phospholipid/cholesterol/gamma-HCH transport system substrate-binding protein
MANRKQVTWTDLRVGLFVLVGLFILGVGVLYITGTGVLAPKYRVKTYLPEVDGLTTGAPVKLDGVEIGNVDAIRMNPQPETRMRNIQLVLSLNRNFQDKVREDSQARLVTEGLLGNRYVSISRGLTGTVIPHEGEIEGIEEAAMQQLFDRSLELLSNLNVLSEHANHIITGIEEGKGTVGLLLTDEELYHRANSLVGRAEELVTMVQTGQGTIGKLVASDELYRKVDSIVGRADNLMAAVERRDGTLGKIIYDPGLYDQTRQAIERGNSMLGGIQQGHGTLGRLVTDDALYNNLTSAAANIETATARLTRGDSSAGKFFTDPAFYDNLTGVAGDLRLLIGDFRQDPRKFLRIKFSIF